MLEKKPENTKDFLMKHKAIVSAVAVIILIVLITTEKPFGIHQIMGLGITGFLWSLFTLKNIGDIIFKLEAVKIPATITKFGPFKDRFGHEHEGMPYVTYTVGGVTFESMLDQGGTGDYVGKEVWIYCDANKPELIVRGGVLIWIVWFILTIIFIYVFKVVL